MGEEEQIVNEMKQAARRKEAEKRLNEKHGQFPGMTNAEVMVLMGDNGPKEKPLGAPELSIEEVAEQLGGEVYINSRGEKDIKFKKAKKVDRPFYG